MNIKVSDIIDSTLAVSTEKGDVLNKALFESIEKNIKVQADFSDLRLIVSTFLNASIGQLYGQFGSEKVQTFLKIVNMEPDDLGMLKLVTDRAKKYFADKEGYDDSFDKDFNNGE